MNMGVDMTIYKQGYSLWTTKEDDDVCISVN